jgi:hypothetical protein
MSVAAAGGVAPALPCTRPEWLRVTGTVSAGRIADLYSWTPRTTERSHSTNARIQLLALVPVTEDHVIIIIWHPSPVTVTCARAADLSQPE